MVMSRWLNLRETAKLIAFRYTGLGAPQYPYAVRPILLAYLINELERLKGIKGNIAEIGVASGKTTRFLCEHIVTQDLGSTLTYYALDTFSSFLKKDIEFEITNRNKKQMKSLNAFAYNDFDIWKKNFSSVPLCQADQSRLRRIRLPRNSASQAFVLGR